MGSGAAEDEALEPEATGAGAGSTETDSVILRIELHHVKTFSTPRWTICHQLFHFLFFIFTRVSASSHIQMGLLVFRRAVGVWLQRARTF